jgi:hypothetical protein
LALLGCGPSVPEAQEARAWFEADSAAIGRFDDAVRRHVESEGLLTTAAADDPNRMSIEAGRERARAGFRESFLPQMTRNAGALGAQVRLLDGPNDTGILGASGTPEPVQTSNNVDARMDGVEVDHKKLGWGVYGIDDADGNARDQRGYEVYWEAGVAGRMLSFRVFMPEP